jgi:hypothetical protein
MALETSSSHNFPIDFKFEDSDIIYIPNNGINHEVTWKALKMSELVKTSFEDFFFADVQIVLGENITNEFVIKLEQTETGLIKTITLIGESYNVVESDVFKIVIDMIKYYSVHGKFHETAFKNIHEISLKMLFEVYKASNFMNISELLNGCAEYIASLIRNKTKEEIELLFSAPSSEPEL